MDNQENTNENVNTEIENVAVNVESVAETPTTAVEDAAPACECCAQSEEEVKTDAPVAEEAPAVESEEKSAEENSSKKYSGKREFKAPANVSPESLEEVKGILQNMFRYLDLQGNISIENRGRSVNVLIASEEPGKIIGHHGNNLESLQVILNRVVQKKYNDYAKIYIDIASDESDPRPRRRSRDAESGDAPRFGKSPRDARRNRDGDRREHGRRDDRFSGRGRRDNSEDGGPRVGRDEKLRMQALDAAKEVRLFGEAKTLPPMNPHDRRIIHMTLENEAGIVTESVGDGDCRSVVISPKD